MLINYVAYQPYDVKTRTFATGWRDDFSYFDSSIWEKRTLDSLMPNSYIRFSPKNVGFKDTTAILALTISGDEGLPSLSNK